MESTRPGQIGKRKRVPADWKSRPDVVFRNQRSSGYGVTHRFLIGVIGKRSTALGELELPERLEINALLRH